MTKTTFRAIAALGTLFAALSEDVASAGPEKRPNILFAISDDQSWLHAGVYGDKVVNTPNFDRVANDGVLFTHAFAAAASCTPSRAAILTGQHVWRLKEAANLMGPLRAQFEVYPDLLEQAGYHVGFARKGYGPVGSGGRKRNPAGPRYRDFEQFVKAKPAGKPFCFWFGSSDPHRPYKWQSGVNSGMKLQDVTVPACLPDNELVRTDLCDYYWEIQRFDNELGKMLKLLEQTGQLDNTLIVVTSDQGMAIPHGKGTLYDLGTRVPLAVSWKGRIPSGRVVDDFISLSDLAPTFLEVAGLKPSEAMTGRSFADVLTSRQSGRADPTRDHVFTATEGNDWCRPGGVGYPSRAIRTHEFLYIRNFKPDRWPAGDPHVDALPQGFFGDIDTGPTKVYMIEHKDDPAVARLFQLGFGKRPAEELYDLRRDPNQLHNVAGEAAYAQMKRKASAALTAELTATKDPRISDRGDAFDRRASYYPARYQYDLRKAKESKNE